MTSLAFIVGLAIVFVVLLTFENRDEGTPFGQWRFGLLSWLVSGNWPAKVGAGLLILGVGALIRYFLLNIGLSPDMKLGSGVVSATLLAAASFHLRARPGKLALHRALAGAAMGVTYLTAYSAYGFFGYLEEYEALAFLVLVVVAGGVFAVNGNALSIAVLSMLGAFAAPAFTIGNPGPNVIYGYYLGVSILTFVLVYLKGWRALIHLSFLFTLAGALFFGWTRQLYHAENFFVLKPWLLALIAIHLAMPLAERHGSPGRWLKRFDQGYFIALPIVAGILMWAISPSLRTDAAQGFAVLGALWALAALTMIRLRIEGSVRHGVIALIFFLGAVLLYLNPKYLSWPLLALTVSSLLLAFSSRLKLSPWQQGLLCGAVLASWLFHALDTLGVGQLTHGMSSVTYLAQVLSPRLLSVAALLVASHTARKNRLPMENLLTVLAVGWVVFVCYGLVSWLDPDYLPQLLHSLIIAAVIVLAMFAQRKDIANIWPGILTTLLVTSAMWAAVSATVEASWIFLMLGPLSLAVLAKSMDRVDDQVNAASMLLAAVIPVALAPWAVRLGIEQTKASLPFALSFITASVLILSWLGNARQWYYPMWQRAQQIHFSLITIVMLFILLFRIERGFWPILFELVGLTTLISITRGRKEQGQHDMAAAVSIGMAMLVLQAMLLRTFGPLGVLTVVDLAHMDLPAMVSLMWAIYGAAICWWGAKTSSRRFWVTGTSFLIAAAAKLVFLDFGSLGQLGNIVALLLAGGVFLAVAWLAPFPPKPDHAPAKDTEPGGEASKTRSSTTAVVAPHIKPTLESTPVARRTQGGPETFPAWQSNEPAALRSAFSGTVIGILIAVFLMVGIYALSVTFDSATRSLPRAKAVPPTSLPVATPVPAANAVPVPVSSPAPVYEGMPQVVTACSRFLEQLPANYVLLAGGGYNGRKLDFAIDTSGHDATSFDVIVNFADRPVVLALGAYEPTIWNIQKTKHTKIAGVWVSGYHTQRIAGLASSVPVLNTSYEERESCIPYFYFSSNNLKQADARIRELFGRSADTYYQPSNATLKLGMEIPLADTTQEGTQSVDSFRDPKLPLAGKNGLEQLVAEGKLRPARMDDVLSWEEAQPHSSLHVEGGAEAPPRVPYNAFVVLGQMTFPAGLYGANAAVFYVPRGIPRPTGNSGHSTIYDMNLVTCIGVACR